MGAVKVVDLSTPDRYGLAVQHGECTVSVMFGKRLVSYVEGAPPAGATGAPA